VLAHVSLVSRVWNVNLKNFFGLNIKNSDFRLVFKFTAPNEEFVFLTLKVSLIRIFLLWKNGVINEQICKTLEHTRHRSLG